MEERRVGRDVYFSIYLIFHSPTQCDTQLARVTIPKFEGNRLPYPVSSLFGKFSAVRFPLDFLDPMQLESAPDLRVWQFLFPGSET